MKRPLLCSTLLLLPLLSLGSATFQPAEAGDWYVGGTFRVGGAHFSLAYDRAHRHHDPYYYRTRHHVRHDGYRCGSYCLKRSGYTYHHAGCPLMLHHFRRHGYHPARAWEHYNGPGYGHRYDRGRAYGHRDYGYRNHGRRDYGHRDYGRRGHGRHDYRYRDDYRWRHRDHDPRYCPYR